MTEMYERDDEPTRFFIVHLQKAAGTTLRDRFRSTLPDTVSYSNASDGTDKRLSVISLSHLLARWQDRRDEVRLVAGHFPLSTVELLDADFVTLSALRPPVDRTLHTCIIRRRSTPQRAKATLAGIDASGSSPTSRSSGPRSPSAVALDPSADAVSNATHLEDAPSHLIERIRHDNALDLALYDFAAALYEDRGPLLHAT